MVRKIPSNRLGREKSPYLLQHQHNPVDWFPWGDEAFAKARAEDKPIFLSIGYSTCHWCHVMERESFEDPAIAGYLNAHFVSIKVDREERPDVDKVYMTSVQALTEQGGWPLSVFLTPAREPFFGGTYFPPETRHGRISFPELLARIQQLWQSRREEVVSSARQIHRQLSLLENPVPSKITLLAPSLLHQAAERCKREFDPRHGGFGAAPKFPRPSQPAFLLRYGVRFGDDEAVRMVRQTCDGMAAGGIHDHLGGGFARYSVDAEWRVPHFEKMLYDNAQLAHLYLDAHLVSGRPAYAEVARDIFQYVQRDMTHPDGGFYSAEDADSEGKEGRFYCWTRAEFAALLDPDEFRVAAGFFGITAEGNFLDHSDPHPLPGQNVLHQANPDVPAADRPWLESAIRKLQDARARRVRPHLDDKILASWNGLMLGAFARGYAVLGDKSLRVAAERNRAFLENRLWDAASRTLFHRWRDDEHDRVQLLEAYAFLLAGVLELYEATLDPQHLDFALALAQAMIQRFHDADHGGFWQTSSQTPELILRMKDDYDGAEPSGNSVAILALLKLAAITGRSDLAQPAEAGLRFFAAALDQRPQTLPALLQALDFWLTPGRRIVVAGDPSGTETQAIVHAIHSVYQPNKTILGNQGAVDPFARALPDRAGHPLAYPCAGTACDRPTADPAWLQRWLRSA